MKILTWFEPGDVSASHWQWVQRCWALFGLLLIFATWPLWTPQTVYPQVPLLPGAGALPVVGQWVAVSALVVSLLVVLGLLPRLSAAGTACLFSTFVAAMAWLAVTDQHRLQPWAYQLTIYAVVFAALPSDPVHRVRGMGLLRTLTVSIYLFSALGKFDFQFLHTVGQQFLEVAWGFVGVEVGGWSWPVRLVMASAFPLAELAVAVALSVARLRRAGMWAAVVLHGLLLVVLGPLGLGHQPGVLIWNVFFMLQAWLLFFESTRPVAAGDRAASAAARTPRRWVPTCVVLAAVCLPLLEPLGCCDHWLAWGLYSPRNSRAIVEVHRAGLPALPAALRPFLENADSEASWVALNIDDWSLAALRVPIYPQDRFQLGVAESIAARSNLERTIRVRLLGMSNRLSGARPAKTLTGRQQITAAANRFRLNAHPR